VTPRATPRLTGYAALAALGLVAALAVRRVELVVLAAPFALVLVAGLTRPPPHLRAGFALDADRTLEGQSVPATVRVTSDEPVDRVEVELALPQGVELEDDVLPVALSLGHDDERELEVELRSTWGSWSVGDIRVRARDRFGLVWWEARFDRARPLRTFPQPERLRHLVRPAHTQAAVGSEVAPLRAEGLEFADTRPFVAGDRLRSVNWRASARLGELVVNERHPERNTDVVLFLDSFTDAGVDGRGIIGQAVRAAATLAELYLARRDRVGLVAFGGTLRWLEPGGGMVQHYRLVDALLETRVRFSYAWKDVNVIPARTLPSRALVIAVTPLLDPRAVTALVDLRARGFDLAVVEVSADAYAARGDDPLDDLAWRLWQLRRVALRSHLQALGVGVCTWDEQTPLDAALEGVRSFRRHARLALR
jgi:uncharacterized protein (DUF58 family)